MKFKKLSITQLAKRVYDKVAVMYKNSHGSNMPVILVTGTVGKSSQTMLISELFRANGWNVFSGTSPQHNYNTLTGLIMTLIGADISFESKSFLASIQLVFKSIIFLLFESYSLPKKSILVYEVGYDHQGEYQDFATVFQKGIDTLVVTAATWEHAQGFDSNFQFDLYNSLHHKLPQTWIEAMDDEDISPILKNTALEQVALIDLVKNQFLLPVSIGELRNNTLIQSGLTSDFEEFSPTVSRGENFRLEVQGYSSNDDYLLPYTFGRTIFNAIKVAESFDLDPEKISKTLKELTFPYSRFSIHAGRIQTTIVDSWYNSDPVSLLGFLGMLGEVMDNYSKGKVHGLNFIPKHTICLGEMRELGVIAQESHQQILTQLQELQNEYADSIRDILLIGSEWLKLNEDHMVKSEGSIHFITFQGFHYKVFTRVGDMITLFNDDTIKPGDWFWIKGSQNTIFLEALVTHLLAEKADATKVCRQGKEWDEARKPFVVNSL